MLVAIASFAFAGAAVLAIVSGSKGGIGESGDQGGGGTGSGEGGGGGGGGGRPHQKRGCFPGPARIVKPPFDNHCIMIFGLMAKGGVHTETALCSARALAKWQSFFDQYFNPISGAGRAWTMRTNPCDGLNKFRASTMTALEFHAKAFNDGPNAPTQVQILANNLAVERNAALAAQEALVAQQVQHQGRLLAANRGMGLVPPSQGVLPPPNLDYAINCNQELVLGELAQRTQSVDTHK